MSEITPGARVKLRPLDSLLNIDWPRQCVARRPMCAARGRVLWTGRMHDLQSGASNAHVAIVLWGRVEEAYVPAYLGMTGAFGVLVEVFPLAALEVIDE